MCWTHLNECPYLVQTKKVFIYINTESVFLKNKNWLLFLSKKFQILAVFVFLSPIFQKYSVML